MSTAVGVGDIRSLIRARARDIFALKNMGDETVECQVSGHFYTFPPRVAVHISDRVDWKRSPTGAILRDEGHVVPKGGEAESIAAQILSEDRLGARGLTFVFGDGHDEERERLARAAYIRWRVAKATDTQRIWVDKVRKVMASPGALPPSQNDSVRADLDFLARYEAGLIDRRKYISKLDGFESDDRTVVLDRIRTLYAREVANAGGNAEALLIDRDEVKPPVAADVALEVNPPKPTPGIPMAPAPASTLPAGDAAFLMEKADELDLDLSKEQLRGLLVGDADVIEEVTEQLAAAAAAVVEKAKPKGKGKKGGDAGA
jgi:hypothetical protein